MKTRAEIQDEIAALFVRAQSGDHSSEQAMSLDGRVRALVWVLTGIDFGWKCLSDTAGIFDALGWKWHRGEDGLIHWEMP